MTMGNKLTFYVLLFNEIMNDDYVEEWLDQKKKKKKKRIFEVTLISASSVHKRTNEF